MISPEFGLAHEDAETEAMKLLARSSRVLQLKQAAKDYKTRGYIKIYSTVLGKPIYLARDKTIIEKMPNKSLPVFLVKDITSLKGIPKEMARTLMEARIIFRGPLEIEE